MHIISTATRGADFQNEVDTQSEADVTMLHRAGFDNQIS